MNLLTPQQTQDAANAEIARGIFRVGEIKRLEKEWRQKLIQAEIDFNDTLARNRKLWEEEELAHQNRKIEMENELLSSKDVQPQDNGDNKDVIVSDESTREKESALETLTSQLEEKLDEVGQRESDISLMGKKLASRQKGIDAQSESIKAQSEALTSATALFMTEKLDFERRAREKKEEWFLHERTMETGESYLEEQERIYKDKVSTLVQRENSLDEREKKLEQPVKKIEEKARLILEDAKKKRSELSEREGLLSRKEFEMREWAAGKEKEISVRILDTQSSRKKLDEERIIFNKEIMTLQKEKDELIGAKNALGSLEEAFTEKSAIFEEEKKRVTEESENSIVQAESILKLAESSLREVSAKEEECARLDSEIVDKIKVLKEKERDIDSRQQVLARNLREYDLANSALAKDTDALVAERREFIIEKTSITKDLKARTVSVASREKAFAAKESNVLRQEKLNSEWAISLKDQEGSLLRAKSELGI